MAVNDPTRHRSDFIDMTDWVIERLTVIKLAGRTSNGTPLWLCQCKCGKKVIHQGGNLRSGNVRSCTCLRDELNVKRLTTHGGGRSKECRAWRNMIYRCTKATDPAYPNYGGRGISVCEQWRHDFQQFLADMGAAPSNQHTLDRINVDGNYEPDNCRWLLHGEQGSNKRNNHRLTALGETLSLAEWSRRVGIDGPTIKARIARGWSVEDALTRPLRPKKIEELDPVLTL